MYVKSQIDRMAAAWMREFGSAPVEIGLPPSLFARLREESATMRRYDTDAEPPFSDAPIKLGTQSGYVFVFLSEVEP